MTTIVSNSSSPYDDDNIPTATIALPSPAIASRRLPPPCWSPEETSVLIEAYQEKWYSLRRGNLRANHWQEVANDVASRFHSSPPKTAVQCRHKMEKLRKRYRAEIQRAATHGGVRGFPSSWAHFQSMHAMEKGPDNRPSPPSTDDEEEETDHKNSIKRINNLHNNQMGNFGNQGPVINGAASGFRIKIPGMVTAWPAETKLHSSHNEICDENHYNCNPRFINSVNGGYGTTHRRDGNFGQNKMGKRVSEISKGDSSVSEVVKAVQALGERFMRIEKVKMDMARQVEEMRIQMELKRTEMILEAQQRIVEAFATTISERTTKKAKRVSNPECSNGVGAR